MMYKEIIAVCSEIHMKCITTECLQNVDYWILNLVVHKVTTGL